MKITHLNTFDITGGAARAAYRLHQGLLSLGQESTFFVAQKKSHDPTVQLFTPPHNLSARFRRSLTGRLLSRSRKPLSSIQPGATLFTDDRSEHRADILPQLPPTEILNLHWIAGLFDYSSFFPALPPHLPVVWTLHDMNPFTGGCHYDAACGKFQQHCGSCPQLHSSRSNDYSSQIWQRKKQAFSSLASRKFHIVTPSRWLAAEAKKSSLFQNFPITVIPYGLDTDLFQPRDPQLSRQLFNIPPHAKVILYVADWANEKRKGLALLFEALSGLETIPDLFLFALGRNSNSRPLPFPSKTLDYIHDDHTLSLAYSAADLLVIPSLQDNLPNTSLEALACGLPTIAFAAGGLADSIDHNSTGLLVPTSHVPALRHAIASLLSAPQLRAQMSQASRQKALTHYPLALQAQRYLNLYQSSL